MPTNRRVTFSTAVLAALLCLAGSLLFSRWWKTLPPPRVIPDFNVVLVVVDSVRADHLGCYGYGRPTSPVIDRLAARGLLFESHVTAAPLPHPALASLLTGLYPKSHGLTATTGPLAASRASMAEFLRGGGYTTAAFVSSPSLRRFSGFEQGFGHFSDVARPTRGAFAVERATAWLKKNAARKSFVFIELNDPRGDRPPPPKYRKWGTAAADIYDGQILYSDAMIGRFVEALERDGLLDKTLLIVTSDRGDTRFAAGHALLSEASLRIPLIVVPPAAMKRKPRRYGYQTSSTDVLPMLLQRLGLASPRPLDGLDLLGRDIRDRTHVFAQDTSPEPGRRSDIAARSTRWKYVRRSSGRDELYDLKKDPGEARNLVAMAQAEPGLPAWYRNLISGWSGGR
jgi:choline-sulfatase